MSTQTVCTCHNSTFTSILGLQAHWNERLQKGEDIRPHIIPPFIICEICQVVCKNFNGLRSHFGIKHKNEVLALTNNAINNINVVAAVPNPNLANPTLPTRNGSLQDVNLTQTANGGNSIRTSTVLTNVPSTRSTFSAQLAHSRTLQANSNTSSSSAPLRSAYSSSITPIRTAAPLHEDDLSLPSDREELRFVQALSLTSNAKSTGKLTKLAKKQAKNMAVAQLLNRNRELTEASRMQQREAELAVVDPTTTLIDGPERNLGPGRSISDEEYGSDDLTSTSSDDDSDKWEVSSIAESSVRRNPVRAAKLVKSTGDKHDSRLGKATRDFPSTQVRPSSKQILPRTTTISIGESYAQVVSRNLPHQDSPRSSPSPNLPSPPHQFQDETLVGTPERVITTPTSDDSFLQFPENEQGEPDVASDASTIPDDQDVDDPTDWPSRASSPSSHHSLPQMVISQLDPPGDTKLPTLSLSVTPTAENNIDSFKQANTSTNDVRQPTEPPTTTSPLETLVEGEQGLYPLSPITARIPPPPPPRLEDIDDYSTSESSDMSMDEVIPTPPRRVMNNTGTPTSSSSSTRHVAMTNTPTSNTSGTTNLHTGAPPRSTNSNARRRNRRANQAAANNLLARVLPQQLPPQPEEELDNNVLLNVAPPPPPPPQGANPFPRAGAHRMRNVPEPFIIRGQIETPDEDHDPIFGNYNTWDGTEAALAELTYSQDTPIQPSPLHHNQLESYKDLVLHLLTRWLDRNLEEKVRLWNLAALFALPAVLCIAKMQDKETKYSSGDFLNDAKDCCRSPNNVFLASYLMNILLTPRQRRPPRPARPNDARTIQRGMKNSILNNRINKAMNQMIRDHKAMEFSRGTSETEPRQPLTVDQMRNIAEALHPRATDNTPLARTADAPIPPAYNLDHDEFTTVLKRCNKMSAPGPDMNTFFDLQRLFLGEHLHEEGYQLVKEMVEQAVMGILPGRFMFGISRLVLIEKSDDPNPETPNDWRPIAISSVYYRLIARFLLHRFSPIIKGDLAPHQFCVGISDGASIGAKLTQFYYDQGYHTLSLDFEKAFQTISRHHILTGIEGLNQPQLASFFLWAYGFQAQLRMSKGAVIGSTNDGVRQGDPLSMLFFAIGIHAPLQRVHALLQRSDERTLDLQNKPDYDSRIIAFADDVNCCLYRPTQHAECIALCREIGQIFEDHGLKINIKKSLLLVNQDHPDIDYDTLADLPELVDITDEDDDDNDDEQQQSVIFPRLATKTRTLGAITTSNDDDIRNHVRSIHDEMAEKCKILHNVDRYPVCFTYLILVYCINALPQYVERIYDPMKIANELADIDTLIDNTLAVLVDNGRPLPAHAKELRHLPHELGGLGIIKHSGTFAAIQYQVLQAKVVEFLATHTSHNCVERFKASARYRTFPSEIVGNLAADSTSGHAAHLGMKKLEQALLIDQLGGSARTIAKAAQIRSQSFKGSGTMFNLGWVNRVFANVHFIDMLRNRLIIEMGDPQILYCSCTHKELLRASPFGTIATTHYDHCQGCQFVRVKLHDSTAELLMKYIKTLHPNAIINTHPRFLHQGRSIIADLEVVIGDKAYVIDLKFTSPTMLSLLNGVVIPQGLLGEPEAPRNVATIDDYAAVMAEEAKRNRYAPVMNRIPHFIPFVLETTGRLGPSARAFLDTMEGREARRRDDGGNIRMNEKYHSARAALITQIIQRNSLARAYQRQALQRRVQILPPVVQEEILASPADIRGTP